MLSAFRTTESGHYCSHYMLKQNTLHREKKKGIQSYQFTCFKKAKHCKQNRIEEKQLNFPWKTLLIVSVLQQQLIILCGFYLQGSDESFLLKINSQHGSSSCFVKSKSLSRASFGVVHFAGTIEYDVRGKLWQHPFSWSSYFCASSSVSCLHSEPVFLLTFLIEKRVANEATQTLWVN